MVQETLTKGNKNHPNARLLQDWMDLGVMVIPSENSTKLKEVKHGNTGIS